MLKFWCNRTTVQLFPLQNLTSITPLHVLFLWRLVNKPPVCKSQCLYSRNLIEDNLYIYFRVGQFGWFKLITAYHLWFSIYLVWNEGERFQVREKICNTIFFHGRWPNTGKENSTFSLCSNYKRRDTVGCHLFSEALMPTETWKEKATPILVWTTLSLAL